MGIALHLSPQLRLTPAMNCSVCGQMIDAESLGQANLLGPFLQGWERCICCHQEVEPPFSHGYKIRFVRWWKSKQKVKA